MSMTPPKFTRREVILFQRLLFLKEFRPGTKADIIKQLEGHGANTSTHEFIKRLIDLSCLTMDGTARVKVANYTQDLPIFSRDKKRMKELWKQTLEFKLSAQIIDDGFL